MFVGEDGEEMEGAGTPEYRTKLLVLSSNIICQDQLSIIVSSSFHSPTLGASSTPSGHQSVHSVFVMPCEIGQVTSHKRDETHVNFRPEKVGGRD